MVTVKAVYVHIGCTYSKETDLLRLYENGLDVLIVDDIGLKPSNIPFFDYQYLPSRDASQICKFLEQYCRDKDLREPVSGTWSNHIRSIANREYLWLGCFNRLRIHQFVRRRSSSFDIIAKCGQRIPLPHPDRKSNIQRK